MDINTLITLTTANAKNTYPHLKISNSFISKTIRALLANHTYEEINTGLVDVDTLIAFCGNVLTRIAVVHCMCDNNDTPFNRQAPELYTRSKTASQMVKTFDNHKEWGKRSRFKCCLIVYDIIKEDPRRLFPVFQKLTTLIPPAQKHHVKEMLLYFLPNHKDLPRFQLEFEEVYSDKKSWELWMTTPFRTNIVQRIVKHVETRTETSAADKTTTRKGITRYIHTLKLLEKFIVEMKKERALGIDPIQWFLASCSRQMFIEVVVHIVNHYCSVQNENVRSVKSSHHGTEFVSSILGLLKNCIPDTLMDKDILILTPNQILPLCVNRREQAPSETRRHFHQSELTKLEEFIFEKTQTKWQLAFMIFKEVGLRVGALSRLMGCDLLDNKGNIRDNVTVLEKMRIQRTFPVSDTMKTVITKYFEQNPAVREQPSYYIFSSDKLGRHVPHSPGYITKKFQEFCDACEIYGKHTHSHAFRHTLVNYLMANGNKIENVSKFIGHASTATTEQYYWTDNLQNIIPQMNIPWLTNKNRIAYPADMQDEEDDELDDTLSTDILVHIILTYHNTINDDQKKQILEKIPRIGDIFKTLCDYSIASSIGSQCELKRELL